jgi:hypothetical protein
LWAGGKFWTVLWQTEAASGIFVYVGFIGVYFASRVSLKLGLEFLFPVSFFGVRSLPGCVVWPRDTRRSTCRLRYYTLVYMIDQVIALIPKFGRKKVLALMQQDILIKH